jgi:C4-dicarboxylate transporter
LIAGGLYSSEVYDVSCSINCQLTLQTVDFTLLSGMTALPFLVDITGSGNISFYTFSQNARTIVQYNNAQSL